MARGGRPPPFMARGGVGRRKVMPNLAADWEGTRLLNRSVLRRLDPAVADILITAYSFDSNTIRWSRKGVEGSLFVVRRNTQPRFQFAVMNLRNTGNLVEDLLSNFEYQVFFPSDPEGIEFHYHDNGTHIIQQRKREGCKILT